MSKKTEVVNWKDRMAADVVKVKADLTPAISSISLAGGIMKVGGEPLEGNSLIGVVVAWPIQRSFYSSAYDPDDTSPPDCYARGETEATLIPASNVENPVHPKCVECPNAEWGSAPGTSKGQACKVRYQLAIIPMDAPESVYILSTPPTSIKHWAGYATKVVGTHGIPPYGVVTEVKCKSVKTWYELGFDYVSHVPEDQLEKVFVKRDEMTKYLLADIDMGDDSKPSVKDSTKY